MGARKALGILGGMGTRATWRFCQRLTDAFGAEKEWDHPSVHVWIEPQIPSRTRALRYDEQSPAPAIADRLARMAQAGITHVAVPCNSAHFWRAQVLELLRTKYQIENVKWFDMVSIVKQFIWPGTLVMGGYVTMQEQLYGPDMVYPLEEYDAIAAALEWLRRGLSATVDVQLLISQLEERYHPTAVLLGCTEMALCGDLRAATVPVLDSSTLYAKGVAGAWNRLSFF